MRRSLVALCAVGLMACSGEDAPGNSPAAVEGADYSGTYSLAGVECYNSAGTAQTAAADFTGSTSAETITVSGNSATIKDTSGSCVGTETAKLVFTASDPSYGTFALSNRSTSTSTGGTCSFGYTLNALSGGAITPSSFNNTFYQGAMPSPFSASYIRNSTTGTIGLFTVLQVSGSSTDLCFLVYLRL